MPPQLSWQSRGLKIPVSVVRFREVAYFLCKNLKSSESNPRVLPSRKTCHSRHLLLGRVRGSIFLYPSKAKRSAIALAEQNEGKSVRSAHAVALSKRKARRHFYGDVSNSCPKGEFDRSKLNYPVSFYTPLLAELLLRFKTNRSRFCSIHQQTE